MSVPDITKAVHRRAGYAVAVRVDYDFDRRTEDIELTIPWWYLPLWFAVQDGTMAAIARARDPEFECYVAPRVRWPWGVSAWTKLWIPRL